MCEKLDFYPIPKVGPKLLLNGAKPQPDHENWLQCPSCGWICPIYEAKTEQSIDTFTQTSDDPFDSQKSVVISASPRRNTKEGKKQSDKRRRERLRPHDEDPEIDALLRIYGEENVRIIQ